MEILDKTYKKSNIKDLLDLGFPVMMENIFQVFIGFIDTYFIGLLGKEAIAGLGVTNLSMNIYIAFFQGISIGTMALIGRNIGKNNKEKVESLMETSILFTMRLSLFIGIFSIIFSRRILSILGIGEEVMAYARPYFLSVAGPSVFLALMLTMSSILRAMGNTRKPMAINIVVNLINIGLNYLLMFGFSNFKGLGILGVGLATTISRLIGVILLFGELRKSEDFKLRRISEFKMEVDLLKEIKDIGLPAGMEKLIMRLGQLTYGRLIIGLGTASYAAHNIAGQIEALSYLPGMAFGVAASSLISRSLGEDRPDEAEEYGELALIISSFLMVLIGLVFFILAEDLSRIFTGDSEVVYLSGRVLRMIALFQPFLAITQVIAPALQGAGDTKFPMYLTSFSIWVIMVVGLYLYSVFSELSLTIVWRAYILDIVFRGLVLMNRYKKGSWKTIEY